MCGIFGFYSLNHTKVHRKLFEESLLKMIHRGPDSQKTLYLCDDRVALGHVRLSIIDLSKEADQPMRVGQYCVIYNGEIYNYIEIRQELKQKGYYFTTNSDTEVLVDAFDYWGEQCVTKFNGMWAFAILNNQTNTLFCSRDRYGVKPFNYFHDKDQFIFASEIKPIISYKPELRIPNYNSIGLYCREGINGELAETWFKGILRLQPGHNLTIKDGNISIRRYYHYPTRINNEIEFSEAKTIFGGLLNDSIEKRMRSDVPVGTTLSGGLDSTSIVSALRTFFTGEHKTFTATFDNFKYDELSVAENTNKILNLKGFSVNVKYDDDYFDILEKIVYHLESGHFSPAIVPLWKVYEVASREVKVVLEGQGADELLGGYIDLAASKFLLEKLRHMKARSFLLNFKLLAHNYSVLSIFINLIRDSLPFGLRELVRKRILGLNKVLVGPLAKSSNSLKIIEHSNSSFTKYLQKSHQTTLVNLLHYGDAISMAFSIESRLPYMDYRLVDFTMTLPSDFIISNGRGKYIQREALKQILPSSIYASTQKLGFPSPSDSFIDRQRTVIKKLLLDSRTISRGIFNKQQLELLLNRRIDTFYHPDRFIFRLINVELWHRMFIDTNE